MKTQKRMWKDINEPKIETLIIKLDENDKHWFISELLDRIPIFLRKNGENKNEKIQQ